MYSKTAKFHLPGLFEFYEFYKVFLPAYTNHREFFYEGAEIASVYGAPADCLWGGGRTGFGDDAPGDVLALMSEYGISSRLTFSNSLLRQEHLSDKKCNGLCSLLQQYSGNGKTQNGVIICSELLLNYLKKHYPDLCFISSTTKVLTDFCDFQSELSRDDFRSVVPDFRLNKEYERLSSLTKEEKDKVEFLCNECCSPGCAVRKKCYESVSHKALGDDTPEFVCRSPGSEAGYRFSAAMKNPMFIGFKDIEEIYLPMGFSNFKIEGRGLGSALLLEFLLYYLTKPEYYLHVREEVYLENTLDLF